MNSYLQQSFYDGENINYILSRVLKIFKEKQKFDIQQNEFFNTEFSKLLQSIFNVESQNGISLNDINKIAIKEFYYHILNNIGMFDLYNDDNNNPSISYENEVNNRQYGNQQEINTKQYGNQQEINTKQYDNQQEVNTKQYGNQQEIIQNHNIEYSQQENNQDSNNTSYSSVNIVDLIDNDSIIKSNMKKKKKNIEKKDEFTTINLNLENISTQMILENITEIELIELNMINSDYIITEYNNEFIFSELDSRVSLNEQKYTVYIEHGDYTNQQLINELELKINSINKNIDIENGIDSDIVNRTNKEEFMYKCSCSEISRKFKIENKMIAFTILECSLLDCLGITTIDNTFKYIHESEYPIKLLLPRLMKMNIFINESDSIFEETIIFNRGNGGNGGNRNDYSIKFNTIKKFKTMISLNDIYIDFGKYNFRNYPFNLSMKIKCLANDRI